MKNNFSRFAYNLLLSFIITILFICFEQIFRIYNNILVFNLDIKSFIEQLILNLAIISIIRSRAIFVIYIILAMFTWFQILHFSYFGTWIFPLEYMLFFTKFKEVFDTFKSVTNIIIIPTIMFFILLVSIYYLLKISENKRLKVPYLSYFLIIAIFINPISLYVKDNTRKGHRPSVEYYPIKNSYLSISHLFAIILPKKFISHYSGLEQPVVSTPNLILKNPNINVIVIMGESANRNFMSLYGYHIKSTPYLDTLKNDKNFIYKSAISSGVVTDVGIPNFFNMIKQPDGVPQAISQNTCLFKMAKENGFQTYFYSAQARNQLAQLKSYLCTNFIDDYFDGTNLTKEASTPALDEYLITKIDDIDFSKPSFITLHQRASHSPFYDTYPKEFEIYNKENIEDKTLSQTLIDYLNSVRYTDYVIENIIKKISEKTDRPTYFIFTSDHSTSIEKNRNGHGRLDFDSVWQIPFFVYGINNPKDLNDNFQDFPYISHYQVGDLVSYLLGYQKHYDYFNTKEDYYVCGADISGFDGILKISFDEKNDLTKDFDFIK
ncbi:phosphoethanolamine transferase [Aliarcobacter butzleri]